MLIRRAVLIMILGVLCGNLSHAQELTVDVDAVKNLVSRWNDAHTSSTAENFSSLYSGKVNFYGASLQRDRCISIKRGLLEEHKDFNQKLNGDLFLTGYSSGVIRCDFVKTVSHSNDTVDYEAYLIIERVAGKYLIVGESDLITDRSVESIPDLGKKVTIKKRAPDALGKPDHKREDSSASHWTVKGVIQLGIALIIGVVGIIFVIQHFRKPIILNQQEQIDKTDRVDKRHERPVKPIQPGDHFERGLAFEKFIVEQFALEQSFFTLLEWRSDKIHEGIFPQSNRNPDLVYRYKCKEFLRTFAVECKYRAKAFKGLVHLMDDHKYRIYEAYHKTEMPVYIVLGFRGEPNKPEELFLIPFQCVKPEMPYQEVAKFRKTGKFFYDMHTDQLT